jgi:hypothetical protein
MVRHGLATTDWRKRENRRTFSAGKLWFAPGRFVTDGNARAVCFHDRSHHHPSSHNSPGLRAGRKWHMAGLCAGDRRHTFGSALYQSFCTLLILSRFLVYVCFHDFAALDGRCRRLEPAPGLRGHGSERRWWLLPLRQRPAGRCDQSLDLNHFSDGGRHWCFHVDCLPRRKNFSAADAVD